MRSETPQKRFSIRDVFRMPSGISAQAAQPGLAGQRSVDEEDEDSDD
jgi:hypothetical protein